MEKIKEDLILPGITALIVIIYKVSESRLLFVESDPGCLESLKIVVFSRLFARQHLSRDKEIFILAMIPPPPHHFKEEIKAVENLLK